MREREVDGVDDDAQRGKQLETGKELHLSSPILPVTQVVANTGSKEGSSGQKNTLW